jgi:hypothetical protein
MSEISDSPRIQIGCLVELELLSRSGECEALAFDLVPDQQADYQAGFLGVSTPLAKAILGEKAGITVPYFTDELQGIHIVSVSPSKRKPPGSAATEREAAVQDAVEKIEFTNAVLFAASVDTKWGEYDADGLDYEKWKARQSKDDAAAKDES